MSNFELWVLARVGLRLARVGAALGPLPELPPASDEDLGPMASCFATPMSSLAMGCLCKVLSTLELASGTTSSRYSCRQGYGGDCWSSWGCGGLCWQKVKAADRLHPLKITEISNPCHQKEELDVKKSLRMLAGVWTLCTSGAKRLYSRRVPGN